MSDVQEQTRVVPTDHGDHDRFAHVVNAADRVRSLVTGEAIRALCGKYWVPTADGTRYPLCPECRELAKQLGIDVGRLS